MTSEIVAPGTSEVTRVIVASSLLSLSRIVHGGGRGEASHNVVRALTQRYEEAHMWGN